MATDRFEPDDDDLHRAGAGDEWWATETAWFSFHHPERALGGWLYTMVRPNIGTVAGGAWVWDERAWLPWEVPYSANYTALELPADLDLRHAELPTGVRIDVVEPTMVYRLGYHDEGRLELDLTFAGSMDPRPLTSGGSTFGRAAHFDQLGRVTGTLVLHGEEIPIDCWAMRDRTWGRRPENRPRRAAYVTGAGDGDNGFLAVTNVDGDEHRVAYGFLRRDGRTEALVEGVRRERRDPERGWATELEIDAEDAAGRRLVAAGRPASRICINRHTFVDLNSLLAWQVDGDDWWGEDQDMWPVHDWSRAFGAARR